MVVGSIPAGGTIDVKRRSAERRFLSTLRRAPAAASTLASYARCFWKASGLISVLQEFEALTCGFDSLEKILKKGVALWGRHLYSIRLPLGHHPNGARNMVGVA